MGLLKRQFPIPMERRLQKLVREFTGCRETLFKHTELYADLRINGDDAWEVFERVHQVFRTSFVGLSLPDFFPGENDPPEGLWLARVSEKPPGLRSFTVGHLLAVVERGQWFEPETYQRTPP